MRNVHYVIAAVAVAALAVAYGAEAGWFQEGGGPQHTGVSPFTITTGGHPQWTYDTGSSISGGVAISSDGSYAYVGASDGFLYCLSVNTVDSGGDDISTGFGDGASSKWSVDLGGTVTVSPTVSADGSQVFVGSGASKFFCIDASSGAIIWQIDVSGAVSSSATLGTDLLFFGTDAFYLYAVEAATGAVSWSCLAKDAITGAPTLSSDSKSLYFGAADTYMYGVTDVYSTTCTAGGVEPSYCQDLIKEGNLQQAGCASWWLTPDNAPVNAPITLDETHNQLFVTSSAAPGLSSIVSVDLSKVTTGNQDAATVTTSLYTSSSTLQTGVAMVGTSTIVFGSDDGYLYAVDWSTAAVSWKYAINSAIASTPVTDGSSIVFGGTDSAVHCVSSGGGNVWSVSGTDAFVAPPSIAPSGMVLMGDTNGVIQAIGTVDVTVVRVLIGLVIGVFVVACCVAGVCVWRRRKREPKLQNIDDMLPGGELVVGRKADSTTAYAMMMHDDENDRL